MYEGDNHVHVFPLKSSEVVSSSARIAVINNGLGETKETASNIDKTALLLSQTKRNSGNSDSICARN